MTAGSPVSSPVLRRWPSVRGAVTRPFRVVARVWRRSIQMRVVISTVVLSAIVVGLLGWTLMRQIGDGLVGDRVDEALAEAGRSTGDVQATLSVATAQLDANTQLPALMSSLMTRGEVRGYDVALIGPLSPGGTTLPDGGQRFSPGLDLVSLPAALGEDVATTGPGALAWTYTNIRYDADTLLPDAPGVVVAAKLTLPARADSYVLYYVFPMSAEERTLALVRKALLTSGVLLLLLMAGVSWLVTRQVVTPIRLARRTAERLASGRLEQRMQVKGEDDLARLAGSFNQMAGSLQRQIRKLEDMSAAQRRFVSDVSHELRTPLTTVRMASDVLHDARDRFDPVTARSAELLQNELDRFETLLIDLLEISRFDAGAADLHSEEVDLHALAVRIAGSIEPLAQRTGVRIVVRAPEHPCVVEADIRRVERVVRNLISNAIDYAESSDVVITLGHSAQACALAVRDYGVGLSPGDEVRVFNRFWRADPARTRTSGGTGLGLSISVEDARLHGGSLEAWGEPGRGSQFLLTLPRRPGIPILAGPLPRVPDDAGASAPGVDVRSGER